MPGPSWREKVSIGGGRVRTPAGFPRSRPVPEKGFWWVAGGFRPPATHQKQSTGGNITSKRIAHGTRRAPPGAGWAAGPTYPPRAHGRAPLPCVNGRESPYPARNGHPAPYSLRNSPRPSAQHHTPFELWSIGPTFGILLTLARLKNMAVLRSRMNSRRGASMSSPHGKIKVCVGGQLMSHWHHVSGVRGIRSFSVEPTWGKHKLSLLPSPPRPDTTRPTGDTS